MRFINWYYVSLAIIGLGLAHIYFNQQRETISFYGFAETNETIINYNLPVMVEQIHVIPGQHVRKGDVLLSASRIKSLEALQDQTYSISELKAEEAIWRSEIENQINVIKAERKQNLETLDLRLAELEKELKYRESLIEGLSTLSHDKPQYQPIKDRIQALKKEKVLLANTYASKIKALEDQKIRGNSPYKEQITHLQAELAFDEENRILPVEVLAPADGIIGTLQCKEAEHVVSHHPLMTFYEPHPSLIKGYVHEDLSLKVAVADSFMVRSVKDPSVIYKGVVTGLGSRIVEIPERLRKVPEFRTYGREVTIEIPSDNRFLQKEKVALELIYRHTPLTDDAQARK